MKKIILLAVFFILFIYFAGAEHIETNANFIFVNIIEGSGATYPVSFINSGESSDFSIFINSQNGFVIPSSDKLSVDKLDEGRFDLIFQSENLETGVYSSMLSINDDLDYKNIPIVLEVESEKKLFDVSVDKINAVDSTEKNQISFYVKFYNLGSTNYEVEVQYRLLKISGEEILSSNEVILVENQLELTKSFSLSSDLAEDNYVFYVSVKQENSVGTGFVLLSNSEKDLDYSQPRKDYLPLALAIIVLLICAFLVINYFWDRKLRRETENWKSNLNQIKREKRVGDVKKKIERLKHQLDILERAYEKRYIKKSSYSDGKRQILAAIVGLKKRL